MNTQNQPTSGFCTKCKKEKHWAKEEGTTYGKASNTWFSNNNNTSQQQRNRLSVPLRAH